MPIRMVFQGQGHLQALLGAGQGLDQQVAQAAEAQGQAHQVVSHLVVLDQAEWVVLAMVVQEQVLQVCEHPIRQKSQKCCIRADSNTQSCMQLKLTASGKNA